MDEHDPGTGIARRHGLVESRMRGDTHVRFGGAGRGTRSSEKGDTAPRPDPYKAGPAGGRRRRPPSRRQRHNGYLEAGLAERCRLEVRSRS
jgi:hypothetical protein